MYMASCFFRSVVPGRRRGDGAWLAPAKRREEEIVGRVVATLLAERVNAPPLPWSKLALEVVKAAPPRDSREVSSSGT